MATPLVGGFNPFEKYQSKLEIFPQMGKKTKNIWNQHPELLFKRLQGAELPLWAPERLLVHAKWCHVSSLRDEDVVPRGLDKETWPNNHALDTHRNRGGEQ